MNVTFIRGEKYDFDRAFGPQCVDLFRCYCQMLGIDQPPPVVGAIDIYQQWDQSAMQKIEDVNDLRVGDVVFRAASSNNRYGHVAIVVYVEGDIITVAEQNGFTLNGLEVRLTARSSWVGCLRPVAIEDITFNFL